MIPQKSHIFCRGFRKLNWKTFANEDLLQWLLDGEPWARYRTLTWLLDKSGNDGSIVATRKAIPKHPLIKKIFANQNEFGYWGTPKDIPTWWPKKNTTFWILPMLADLGFTREDKRVTRACEYVFTTQLPSGAFGWSPAESADCHTAVITEAMAKLGLLQDPRLQKAYRWLVQRQRLDGGFWCKDTSQVGGPREKEPSCAMATMFVLGALAQNLKLLDSKIAMKGVDFLFACWENRERIRYAGHDSQIRTGWEKLKYPFIEYRIIKFLDVLSRFKYAKRRLQKSEMVKVLISKRDSSGRFTPESIHKTWSDFEFGQKQKPSRWITLLVLRVLKRIYE